MQHFQKEKNPDQITRQKLADELGLHESNILVSLSDSLRVIVSS
jgi:hypothetical protein